MSDESKRAVRGPRREPPHITQITVGGYKSIVEAQSLEIRPLTILAGANSSGKSSAMQPLLLLKQTLSEGSDPGAILLDGPNVRCTAVKELLPHPACATQPGRLSISVSLGSFGTVRTDYAKSDGAFRIEEMAYREHDKPDKMFRENMKHEEIIALIPKEYTELLGSFPGGVKCRIMRARCFLEVAVSGEREGAPLLGLSPASLVAYHIKRIIHLPGLRGNPLPTYPVRAVSANFPGQFQDYVASVIDKWQSSGAKALGSLKADLSKLGLTWKVEAKHVGDTQLELRVGRLRRAAVGGQHDLINIAHVGFGVSQALPVLVALWAAQEDQLVYLEQPEIHLHPKAQLRMAEVLADAARRKVRIVCETHSALLLLGIQRLVAGGHLDPGLVKLHWFERDEKGATKVTSRDLDEEGAFGDWPEDFGDTELTAQAAYLDAVDSRKAGKPGEP